jgi:alkylhydroperoxidase family enzyme
MNIKKQLNKSPGSPVNKVLPTACFLAIGIASQLFAQSGAPTASQPQLASPSPKAVSKSGIPYLPDNEQARPHELVSAIRARRPGGKLLNLDRMLLNSPAFAQGWNDMFGTIRGKLSLPAKLRELAIMSVGVLNKADYVCAQHTPDFLAAGGTREQMQAIQNPAAALADTNPFDEPERATLALTYEMTRNMTVTDATMRRVRTALPDQQVVELIGVIAGYNMVSRFVVATGIDPE